MLVICAVLVSYMSSQKTEFIIVDHTRNTIVCVPYGSIMRRKYFAGNFSACIITTMNISDKSKCKKHSLEALKVIVDKPLNVIN